MRRRRRRAGMRTPTFRGLDAAWRMPGQPGGLVAPDRKHDTMHGKRATGVGRRQAGQSGLATYQHAAPADGSALSRPSGFACRRRASSIAAIPPGNSQPLGGSGTGVAGCGAGSGGGGCGPCHRCRGGSGAKGLGGPGTGGPGKSPSDAVGRSRPLARIGPIALAKEAAGRRVSSAGPAANAPTPIGAATSVTPDDGGVERGATGDGATAMSPSAPATRTRRHAAATGDEGACRIARRACSPRGRARPPMVGRIADARGVCGKKCQCRCGTRRDRRTQRQTKPGRSISSSSKCPSRRLVPPGRVISNQRISLKNDTGPYHPPYRAVEAIWWDSARSQAHGRTAAHRPVVAGQCVSGRQL